MKVTTNYHIFGTMMGCLETAEASLGRPFNVDGNDEKGMKDLFRQYVLPDFLKMLPENKEKCYWTFRYYLTTHTAPIDEIRANVQDLGLDMPVDSWLFVQWLWEVLWPGACFRLEDLSNFVEHADMHEAGKIFAYPSGYWGQESAEAERMRRYADNLAKEFGIE